jgi:hypothetical protein
MVVIMSILGVWASAASASAALGDYGPVTITTDVSVISLGGTVTVEGTGFTPGETILLVVTYAGPSGLRRSPVPDVLGLRMLGQSSKADALGNFSAGVNLTRSGWATITATGQSSRTSVSTAVKVMAAGQTSDTTTVAGSTASTVPNDGVAAPPNSQLPNTGTSIAGPLAVGASALVLGLGMLLFGTRFAIRRKRRPSTH